MPEIMQSVGAGGDEEFQGREGAHFREADVDSNGWLTVEESAKFLDAVSKDIDLEASIAA